MKRTTGALAMTGIAALLLTACGNGDAETPAAPTTDSTQQTTDAAAEETTEADTEEATEGTTTDEEATTEEAGAPAASDGTSLVIWADDLRAAALQEHAQAFEDETGVPVNIQVVANEKLREQFKDSVGAGAGPDIAVGAHDWLGELVQNNVVAPIQLSAEVSDAFTPESIEAVKFAGQTYAVPYAVESLALIRNTALAPEAPATMEALVEHGKQLVADGETELIMTQEVGADGNAFSLYPYLSAYGGGIFPLLDEGGFDGTEVILDSEDTIKGAEKIAWLAEEGALATTQDASNVIPLFAEGKAPYMISGPWAIGQISEAGIEYAIDPIPDFEDGGETSPFLGVQAFFVSAESKNPQIAQTFVQEFASRPEVQISLFEAGDRPPALTEAYEQIAADNEDIAAWGAAAEGATPMPNIPQMNAVWGPLGKATAGIVSGESAADRMGTAQSEVEAALAQ